MLKTNWTVIKFGKFKEKGMTLPQIALADPDWFFYVFDNKGFSDSLAREAQDVAAKARTIRIPGKSSKRWKVRYFYDRNGRFERLDVVDYDDNWQPSEGDVRHSHFIDLSMIRELQGYDKQGNKRLIKSFKYWVFGRTNYKLTQSRCENFFDNPDNFGSSRQPAC